MITDICTVEYLGVAFGETSVIHIALKAIIGPLQCIELAQAKAKALLEVLLRIAFVFRFFNYF